MRLKRKNKYYERGFSVYYLFALKSVYLLSPHDEYLQNIFYLETLKKRWTLLLSRFHFASEGF